MKLAKSLSRKKVVNSKAEPIYGLAKGVNIQIENWSKRTNFMALPLDDFQVILMVEFLYVGKSLGAHQVPRQGKARHKHLDSGLGGRL